MGANMEVTLASVLASAIDPVKIALSFGAALALRQSIKWLAIVLGAALLIYICIAIGSSSRPGALLVVHVLSCVALLGLAALILRFAGGAVTGVVGATMSVVALGAVWFAISASAQNVVPDAAQALPATTETQLTATAPKPAHSFLNVQTTKADPSNPELRWLSKQTEEYQAAIFRGDLPEGEDEQRKVGMLMMGLRQYFHENAQAQVFLLSTSSLPLLVELRSILHDQLLFVDDADGITMLMHSSTARTNSRVHSILKAIQAQSAM